MTAATPMTMPRMVRKERNLLAARLRKASVMARYSVLSMGGLLGSLNGVSESRSVLPGADVRPGCGGCAASCGRPRGHG